MSSLQIKKGASRHSAYDLRDPNAQPVERHTLAVIVDNEAGVLARVIGLFSGRGYNIDSLTVAEVDHAGTSQPDHHRDHRNTCGHRPDPCPARTHGPGLCGA
jgi:hypothetical protein